MVQTQVLGGLSWQNKLRVERIVAWANLTQVTPMNCWPGIAARRCNARSIAELEAGTVPTYPLIASVHADMLTLGFEGGLLDMEVVVHSDRRKRERPAREAEALKGAASEHSARCNTGEERVYTHARKIPGRLVTAEVADATKNWWNATNFLEPKSARRWARLWGNHALRDRECPIPRADLDDEDDDDTSDDDNASGVESDDNDDACDTPVTVVQTIRTWRKQLCTAALRQQHTEWSAQRELYTASHGGQWGGSACLWVTLNADANAQSQSQWTICLPLLRSCTSQGARAAMIRIWAGVVPTLRSFLLVNNARKASMAKDAKTQWVQCPCGAGPQDSEHLLHCVHKELVRIRKRAVSLADVCMRDNKPARGQSTYVFSRCRSSWSGLDQMQRTRASLGSTGTGMSWYTRSVIVAEAANSWQELERAWTVVNTET